MTKNKPSLNGLALALLLLAVSMIMAPIGHAQAPAVHIVFFYSPYCGHCHQVIDEVLPPIVEAYNTQGVWSYYGDLPDEQSDQLPPIVALEGNVLQILYVDTTSPLGGDLYQSAVERFEIPAERQAVPTMVIGEVLLIGSVEIPERMPGLIDDWLSEGGLAWPDIPGLAEIVNTLTPFPGQVQEAATPGATGSLETPIADPAGEEAAPDISFEIDRSQLSVVERIQLDPFGNALAIVVLMGMLFSLVGACLRWRMGGEPGLAKPFPWILLLLILLGTFVAGYLSFVETTGAEAVCGPVGDCNTVQSSEYARIFGFLPVGILGLFAYLAMLVAWLLNRRIAGTLSEVAPLALFGMALLGSPVLALPDLSRALRARRQLHVVPIFGGHHHGDHVVEPGSSTRRLCGLALFIVLSDRLEFGGLDDRSSRPLSV